MWRPLEGAYQTVNCDPLITWPAVEEIIHHPPILDAAEALLGAPICLSEACLRHMAPYEGEGWRRWHRDRLHWQQHPLRTQYIHALVYLADVDETHPLLFPLARSCRRAHFGPGRPTRPRRYRRSARPGRHRGAVQPLSAAHGDHPPDAARTQIRTDLLRSPRPTPFEQLHDPARSTLARPFRSRGSRLLFGTQSQVAGFCRGLWRICT